MAVRVTPYLILAGLALLFFAPMVVHPDQVLYSDYSDLLALHLPAKQFLVRSWQQTGELPLWCPYRFAGVPFVHDIQVAAFYPLHWPLYALPQEWVGPALSWLIVVHVIAAGWCMYAYARTQGLGCVGALVAGCGYMFAGKWMLHLLGAGHYITIGLAWLPLVLLWLEQAIRGPTSDKPVERAWVYSLLRATGAGIAYALLILGTHPQWTFYAGLFVGLWTLAPALERAGYLDGSGTRSRRRTLASLGRWLGWGAWTVVVALGSSAVQLLPTLEATAQSMRGAGVGSGSIWQLGLLTLVCLIGPALTVDPPSLMWEERGGLNLVWVALAALAPLLGGARVRFQAVICVALVLFAVGGAALLQGLPGFQLFRQPSRMLLIVTLPVALLAGTAVQSLLLASPLGQETRRRCLGIVNRVLVLALILVGGLAVRLWMQGQPLRPHMYWATLLLTVPALYGLLHGLPAAARRSQALAWFVLLLADLWALAWPLVEVRPEAFFATPSASVRFLAEHRDEQGRVLDRDPALGKQGSPLGTGAPLAMVLDLEAVRGYTPLDVLRFKKYLQFIGDSDKPLRPFETTGAFEDGLTFPIIGDFPLENQALLDLLGTRYLLQPRGPAAAEYLSVLAVAPEAGAAAPPWVALLLAGPNESLQPGEQLLAWRGWKKFADDPRPVDYDCVGGGVQQLPPYGVYENIHVLPRAFVVPEAAPLPAAALHGLVHTDFRRTVLLEDWQPGSGTSEGSFRPATVRDYRPNRVVVDVPPGSAGYLVVADIWFPGWTCTVDGEPARVYRANYLFRAVALTPGAHEVVFTFEPVSYTRGRVISLATLAGVTALGLLAVAFRRPIRARFPAPDALHSLANR